MIRLLLVIGALSSSILMKGCDIDLGDLDQYVINWKVTVTNVGPEAAAVTVQVHDRTRSATLKPGEVIDVVSFRPGVWHVTIIGASTRKQLLEARYAALAHQLDALPYKNSKAWDRLDDDLDDIEDELRNASSFPNVGTCAGRMDDKGGDTLAISASLRSGVTARWSC